MEMLPFKGQIFPIFFLNLILFYSAVCNLTGGAFEFSILGEDYYYEILSTNSDPLLGGQAFDNAILNYFVSEFKRENGIDLTKDPVAIQRLSEAAEKAKCQLSGSTQTEIILPNIILDSTGINKHFQIKLTRSKFEELTENLIQKIGQLCEKTLKDAGIKNKLVDGDNKKGGSDLQSFCFWRNIRNVIEDIFKKEIDEDSQLEDGKIALGAVYLGVIYGDINYLDDKRICKNRAYKLASRKMFLEERNEPGPFCLIDFDAKYFLRIMLRMIKKYYASLHIDIQSRSAIKILGEFALDSANDKEVRSSMALHNADHYSTGGFGCYGMYSETESDVKGFRDEVYNFFKNFMFINKKKVWTKLKPYVYKINLSEPTEEEKKKRRAIYSLPLKLRKLYHYRTIKDIKFKKIKKIPKTKGFHKLKAKKKRYFLFRAY
ncbi:unnamed protein product [Meloidogyne enterolobii]|uniref:Uncharacterized protein n=1 Tax=Meloidogyne enterolobii TaxID=390850 RepID=A0ACB0Z3J5_MELEN